jgi:hypothetical protein
MGRIFNIYFEHEGHSYSALVTIAGKKDCDETRVNISGGNIQIQLPNGRLVLPISEVLHHVSVAAHNRQEEGPMRITDSISLQLLNTSW